MWLIIYGVQHAQARKHAKAMRNGWYKWQHATTHAFTTVISRTSSVLEPHMPQQMNGAQRKSVWIRALGVFAAVVTAGFGVWATAHQDPGSHNNSCRGPAVCGMNNDGNTIGNGNSNGKK
ncbi:hypothetical protein [Streptomyces sp. NPDC054783]